MNLRPKLIAGLLLAALLALPGPGLAAGRHLDVKEYDDCDANFIAFVGADAYQFSPLLPGALGQVRLFSILSFQRAAAFADYGRAAWRLTIEGENGVVRTAGGSVRIEERGAALAEMHWDGRDDGGQLVAPGKYRYTFHARYLPDRLRGLAARYDELEPGADIAEAHASTRELVVDYGLDTEASLSVRASLVNTSCQTQQNAPLEGGFPFNFYYGSTHAHSNFSDGGHPTGSCSSGNAYGSGTSDPAGVFDYARNTAGLDFWVVNEHNHLINDSVATNNPPVTEAKVRQRYQDGRDAAAAATVDGAFVAVYGMEWGVSTNTDQGHVTLLETPVLFGWETCTGCNGPSTECTPGTDCYFDVFTPKRFGYLTLYQRSVENPSPAGALGILCHPGSGEFDNYAFDANADEALQGIAVRSGLAFTTATDCATTNIGATDYSGRWKSALNLGFHLGPAADHDSHCNNYGVGLPTRTVYLLPNAVSPALTKTALLQAHKARHFFATEDSNAQVVFATSDNAHVMGDIFSAGASVTLRAAVYDPNGEGVSTLEVWRGQIGGGVPASAYQSVSGQASLSFNESPGTGTYYYYVHAVQADGHDLWSAPMWITFTGGGGGDTQAPTTAITAPGSGATVSGTTLVTASASDNVGVTSVEFRLDGVLQATDTTAPYEWSWNTATTGDGGHTLQSTAYDAAGNSGSSSIPVTVSNGGGTPGQSADVSGWRLTQANATYEYTIPAGTVIPADGYLVVARNATRAAFEAFWGVTLGSNVVFLSASDGMPVINGSETYGLYNAVGALMDGQTIAMASGAGQSIRRADPCGAASSAASWSVGASSLGNPGSGAAAGCGGGVKINEFSDATGTGNFIYEFLELHNDSAAAADTEAPVTAITAPSGGANVSGTTPVTASATDNVGVSRVEFWLDGALASTDTTDPYEWAWDTLTATNASHSLQAKAFDDAGNEGSSTAISVTVFNDTTPPSTSITSPSAGATVSSTVSVAAGATDDVGVTAVEFYLDGALQATDSSSPYSWSWSTTGSSNGSHTLQSRAYDAAGNSAGSTVISVTVSNDLTAPSTSITAPASGATVSGTVSVTASASDNVGVTQVEFLLDGALQSTDTTSPYSWSWATTGVANGSHTLQSKAYDAAGNVGSSTTITVTVNNVTGTSIASWRLVQANSSLTYTFPAGTTIPSKGFVIVGRNATKAQFEAFWGVTLGANVVYLNAADTMPQINGSETYTLYNSGNTKMDGATVAMASAGGESLQRKSGCSTANKASSWNRLSSSAGAPGTTTSTDCGKGVFISEFSDAAGTSNYIYEFVELRNDK